MASFALVTSDAAAGKGPVYAADGDAGLLLDPALTATTSAGRGFFGDVAAGDVDLAFSHPTRKCSRNNKGWPSSSATMKVRVMPGRVAYVAPLPSIRPSSRGA